MTSGAPWSVKGIDPKAREVAKDLARRSGMTLGEWLNRMILEDEGPEDIGSESYFTDPNFAPRAYTERPSRPSFDSPIRPEPLREAPARFEAPEHPADEILRVTRALDRLTDRIENSEGRTGMAITGVEHSVREAVARIEAADRDRVAIAARFEGVVDETRAEQARLAERVRRVESEAAGPRSAEALRALEQALGRVATHLYEGENDTRQTLAALRERIERVEAGAKAPGVEVIEEVVDRVGARLTEAEARTAEALEGLRASFAGLDGRIATVEAGATPGLDERLEQLSSRFSQRLETTRGEMAKTLQASAEGRFDRMERKLSEMADQVRQAEQRSAQAIERVGQEVLTVAESLNRRVDTSDSRNADAIGQVAGEVARIGQTVDNRLTRNDTVQAEAMEKLGAEIARISERLADRIANAERRSAQAFDEMGEQVARVSDHISQHGDRASDELVERIRQSEERTARLLDEAREKIDARLGEAQRRITEQVAVSPAGVSTIARDPAALFGEPEPFPLLEDDAPVALAPEPAPPAEPVASVVEHGPAPGAPAPQAAATPRMQPPGLMTRSGFATPPPKPPVATTQPVVPEVADDDDGHRTAAEAFAAPSIFAADPFPATSESRTFDADDFEVADGFAEEPATEAAHEHAADLEGDDDGFASELDLAEAKSAGPFASSYAFGSDDAEPALPEPPASSDHVAAEDAHTSETEAAAASSLFDLEDADDAAFDVDEHAFADEPAHAEADHHPEAAFEQAPAEPAQPLSTREVIEQARAAARAAAQNDGKGRKSKAEKGGSFFSFLGGRSRRRAGSTLQAVLFVVGATAALSVGAAGFVLMKGQPGGAPPKRVADAIASLSGGVAHEARPTEADTTPFPATPRVAMVLSPQTAIPGDAGQATPPDLADRFAKAAQAVELKTPGAADELKAVAELGHAPAQFYLAKLYEKGEGGLKRDPAAARQWTERAAEGGDRRAMHNLGMSYIEGSGGAKNSTTAAQWFRRAADLGLVDSQFNLAALFEQGLGVSQNGAEAYKWYLIAAKSGDADARKRADQVKTQLSPDARMVAERAAMAFRAASPNPSTAPAATADIGAGADNVIVAQRALSRLGYYKGPSDGAASPALKMAVAAYQRDHDTAATGVLDPSTLQGLSVYTR